MGDICGPVSCGDDGDRLCSWVCFELVGLAAVRVVLTGWSQRESLTFVLTLIAVRPMLGFM